MALDDSKFLTQILNTLHNRIDDNLDNGSYDNELIQFFEAPHDYAKLTAFVQSFVASTGMSASPNEIAKLTAQVQANLTNPSTLCWGGYDSNGTWHAPNWYWGYGGVYK